VGGWHTQLNFNMIRMCKAQNAKQEVITMLEALLILIVNFTVSLLTILANFGILIVSICVGIHWTKKD